MARPEEKAQAMLNKWVKMRSEGEDGENKFSRDNRRPFLASHCEHLHDAEKFRRQIVREISEGIRKVQNPGMGEHSLRDLNDSINKLIREKWHWNRRIKELGGPDYNAQERKQQLSEGDDQAGMGLRGSGGYRYFGAAKDLPGVKELFARHAAKMTKRRRGDVYKYITSDYYGLRDEEDGVLKDLEEKVAVDRKEMLEDLREDYRRNSRRRRSDDDGMKSAAGIVLKEDSDGDSAEEEDAFLGAVGENVPSEEEVAQALLERKKKELLSRFG